MDWIALNLDRPLLVAVLYCTNMYRWLWEDNLSLSDWRSILNTLYRSVELYDEVHRHPTLADVDAGWLMVVCIQASPRRESAPRLMLNFTRCKFLHRCKYNPGGVGTHTDPAPARLTAGFDRQTVRSMYEASVHDLNSFALFRDRSAAFGPLFEANAPLGEVMGKVLIAADWLLLVKWFECERDADELVRYYPRVHYTTYVAPRPGLSGHLPYVELGGLRIVADGARAEQLAVAVLSMGNVLYLHRKCEWRALYDADVRADGDAFVLAGRALLLGNPWAYALAALTWPAERFPPPAGLCAAAPPSLEGAVRHGHAVRDAALADCLRFASRVVDGLRRCPLTAAPTAEAAGLLRAGHAMETAERVLVEQLVEPGAADHAAVTAAFGAIARVVRAAAARWGLRLAADPHAEAVTQALGFCAAGLHRPGAPPVVPRPAWGLGLAGLARRLGLPWAAATPACGSP
jgi:hypothetical protein